MMGVLDFLKKRREEELTLPQPPELPKILRGDIEPIKFDEPKKIEIPELPKPEEMLNETKTLSKIPDFKPIRDMELPEIPRIPPLPAPKKEIPTIEKEVEKIRIIPKPAYVGIEDYKKIINDTNTIRSKLMDAENFVKKLGEIKNDEEKAFERWRTQIEDVEKKLNYVDQIIAKAGD